MKNTGNVEELKNVIEALQKTAKRRLHEKVELQKANEQLAQTIAEKDKIISDLQKELEGIRRHEQTLNNVWKENLRENREYWDEYAAEQFKNGIEFGIQEERKKRNAGRKKNPFLEEEYFATAQEIQRLLDMGHTMKEIIENGMITKVNPKTKQIEPVSKSTIYRCMRAYKSSTK